MILPYRYLPGCFVSSCLFFTSNDERGTAVSNTNINNIHSHHTQHCIMASMASTTRGADSDGHDHDHDHPLQSRFIGMFSYGSNNEQQLRARVNSPQLRYVGVEGVQVWCVSEQRLGCV